MAPYAAVYQASYANGVYANEASLALLTESGGFRGDMVFANRQVGAPGHSGWWALTLHAQVTRPGNCPAVALWLRRRQSAWCAVASCSALTGPLRAVCMVKSGLRL